MTIASAASRKVTTHKRLRKTLRQTSEPRIMLISEKENHKQNPRAILINSLSCCVLAKEADTDCHRRKTSCKNFITTNSFHLLNFNTRSLYHTFNGGQPATRRVSTRRSGSSWSAEIRPVIPTPPVCDDGGKLFPGGSVPKTRKDKDNNS